MKFTLKQKVIILRGDWPTIRHLATQKTTENKILTHVHVHISAPQAVFEKVGHHKPRGHSDQTQIPVITRSISTLVLRPVLLHKFAEGGSRDGVVSIVTRLQSGRSGDRMLGGVRNLPPVPSVHSGSGVHSVSYLIGNRSSFPKRPECEADLSLPGEEFKNEWSYTSIPPICLYGMYRDKFTFYHRLQKLRCKLHKISLCYPI